MGIKRICIYPKDIAIITGKSISTAKRLHQTIRDAMNKKMVTIKDFALYTGISEQEINIVIQN